MSLGDRDLLSLLDDDARELLRDASKDRNGAVLATDTFGGFSIETKQKNLIEGHDARSEARGRRILRQLLDLGLLEQRDRDGNIFSITDEGFRVVDLLS